MPEIIIDNYQCVRCGQCVLCCPSLLYTRKNLSECPSLVPKASELCINCGHCVAGCPVGAITIDNVGNDSCLPIPKECIPRLDHISTLVRMRRSIRHFAEKPIETHKIELLMDIVRWAPTARNMQQVKWIVINSREKMHELAGMMIKSMKNNEKFQRQVEAWDIGKDVILRGAPALAIAYTDSEYSWGEVDSTIAIQTLDLCATAMRFGTCWAGYFIALAQNVPDIPKWLGLQSNEKIQAALMFGYPGFEAYHRIPYRKEIDLRLIR